MSNLNEKRININKTGTYIRLRIGMDKIFNAELFFENEKLFKKLNENKDEITEEFKDISDWLSKENGRKSNKIVFSKEFIFEDKENWDDIYNWQLKNVEQIKKLSNEYI